MDLINSIIFGLVQALTEFLPISSSGHLIIFHKLFESELLNSLTFDVILHAGTLLAVIIYFWKDIVNLVSGFIKTVLSFKISHKFNEQLPWLIIIGTIPAALVGFFLDNFIEQFFRSVYWVVGMLIFGAILFIIFEIFGTKNRKMDSMTFFDSLLIGLAQVLAFIPGTSRSGITIVAGMSQGFKRGEAAKFSFLLSIPIILGATLKKVTQIPLSDFSTNFIFVSILGILTASAAGYFVIKLFLKFLEKSSLIFFAVYRIILAAIISIIFIF